MKPRSVSCSLAVLAIAFAAISGCTKEEEAPPVEEETAPQATVQDVEQVLPEVAVSADMEQFLAKVVSAKQVSAGHGIREYFDFWQEILHHPRIAMKVYFEVETEGTFRKDHDWRNMTNREILDAMCREYNLVWTIAKPDTIRIARETE
jgi:hypothetical protein